MIRYKDRGALIKTWRNHAANLIQVAKTYYIFKFVVVQTMSYIYYQCKKQNIPLNSLVN